MADNANALVLSVSADTSKALKELEKLNKKLDGLNDSAKAAGKKTQASLNSLFGKPGQAFDKIFDSTRFKVLDSGAARVGLFGSSLEKLGVAGLGAAAAVGAVAFALNQAEKAIAFSDELEDTAKRLHITTDALQEYRYAIRALGGDEKGADDALEQFSETLGKAQAGLPKAVRAFKELGFTDAQIKGFTDVESTLTSVNEKISKLKSPAQKDAVVAQLGLTGLKEAVEGLPQDFAAARLEAHKAGVVFSAELIAKASGLDDKLKTINERISVDMKSAFVSLGPVLIDIKGALAKMLEDVLALIDGFRKLENRNRITLEGQLEGAQTRNAELTARYGTRIPLSKYTQFEMNKKIIADNSLQLAKMDSEEERRRQGEAAKSTWERLAGGTSLNPQTKTPGPSPASQVKHFDAELARISEQILAASDDDLHTLLERQAIAQKRLALESAAARTAILDEVATKAITGKQGEVLLAKQAEAAAAKKTQLDAQQAQALRQLALKQEQDLVSAVAALLDAQLGLTRSAEERGRLEAQILAAQRSIARKLLEQALADDPSKSQAQKNVEISAFDATTGALGKGQEAKAAEAVAVERRSVQQASLDAELQGLQLADQLAQTAAEHRTIALRRLDLQEQLQRLELEGVIASKTATDAEVQIAKAKLEELAREHAGQVTAAERGTAGPLEQLRQGLPDTAAKMNEAMESVSARGLQSLEDGLVGVITHTQKLGDVFREVAAQIIADLARIAIQRAIIGPLESAIAGATGGPLAAIGSLFGGKRAAGGPVIPGKVYEINETGQELFAPSVAGSIIPHSAVRAAAGSTGAGGPSITVVQPLHLHAEGAIMTKEFVRGINEQISQSSRRAALAGAEIALRGMPAAAVRHSKLSG